MSVEALQGFEVLVLLAVRSSIYIKRYYKKFTVSTEVCTLNSLEAQMDTSNIHNDAGVHYGKFEIGPHHVLSYRGGEVSNTRVYVSLPRVEQE